MKTFRVGLLGAGKISRKMAETLHGMEDFEPYAVASRGLEKAQQFAAECGIGAAYGSYEEMLADEKVDLVYVATPHSLHAQHAMLCIEHGKPALVEKPFTGNAKQAEEVFKLARKRGVFISEAIWTRYTPQAKLLRQLVQSGAIGEVHLATGELGFDIDEIPRMAQPELAGGALLDLGVYPLTFAAIAFGSDWQHVKCEGQLTDLGVDAQNSVLLRYPGKRLAVLCSTMLANTASRGMVYGDRGHIEIDTVSTFAGLRAFDKAGNVTHSSQREAGLTGFEYQVAACRRALAAGQIECEKIPHDETLRIMRLMDTVRAEIGVRYPFD